MEALGSSKESRAFLFLVKSIRRRSSVVQRKACASNVPLAFRSLLDSQLFIGSELIVQIAQQSAEFVEIHFLSNADAAFQD